MSGMTSTSDQAAAEPPNSLSADAVRRPGVGVTQLEQRAELRARGEGVLWYLALCRRCDFLGQPFRSESDRDAWAAKHVTGTGHVVLLTIDGLDNLPQLHLSGVLSRVPFDQRKPDAPRFRFVCPADECGVSVGPFETAELAIAQWRTHPVPVSA